MSFFRVRVTGVQQVPAQGPVILAINHLSMLDPLIIGVTFPRPIHYMAKEELFRYPLLGHLLRWVGTFPVRRGEADREAIQRSLQLLKKGRVVGVFPEGTRSDDGRLREIQGGTALLALRSGAPILPIAIWGTGQAMPRGRFLPKRARVLIHIGEAIWIQASNGMSGHDRIREISRQLARQLGELLRQLPTAEPGLPSPG